MRGRSIADIFSDRHKVPFKQYKADLINARKRESLVTARGNVDIIKNNMSNPAWVDMQPSA